MSNWNYRIGTFIDDSTAKKLRIFEIIEVFYNDDGKINGYGETNTTNQWESIVDLHETVLLCSKASQKPVIDLDNFPEEYDGENVFIRKNKPFIDKK